MLKFRVSFSRESCPCAVLLPPHHPPSLGVLVPLAGVSQATVVTVSSCSSRVSDTFFDGFIVFLPRVFSLAACPTGRHSSVALLGEGSAHLAEGLLPGVRAGWEGGLPALRAERCAACPVLHAPVCPDPTSERLVPF